MIARFDLMRRTASFDFFTWALNFKLRGATEIVFGTKSPKNHSWPRDEIMERFRSIVQPGPPLMSMYGRLAESDDEGTEEGDSHKINKLAELALNSNMNWRMKSVWPASNKRFTVTLRQSNQKSFRNSNERVWRQFAHNIGAHLIEDYSVKKISLYERFALYAGAKMNFGVVNGPLAVLFYTKYPVMMCDCSTDADHMAGHGIEEGTNHPLALPNQSLVWEKPTLENLMQRFEELNVRPV